jgi:hypothetical protein
MKKRNAMERIEQMRLKTKIADQLRTFHPEMRKTLLENLSELVAALTQARHVHLSKIAEKLYRAGDEASREQWVRRQLDNRTMGTLDIFKPLAVCLLKGLAGKTIRLILDPTDLDETLCIVMISLAYRQRVLPLAWVTFEIKPGALDRALTHLFETVSTWLPKEGHIYIIADREFRGMDMVERFLAYGWSPIVRCKTDIYGYTPEGTRFRLAELAPEPGQTFFLPFIRLTDKQAGPFHLSVRGPERIPGRKWEPWFILSVESPGNHILNLYAIRMWIDETFRDLKSYGFHLDQTGLRDVRRIDRLVLVLVLACWWVMNIGRWLDRMGLRRYMDRAKRPKLSIFQLGLRFVNRQLHLGNLPDVQFVPVL